MVLVPADRMMALLPQRPIRENIAAPLYNRVARWGPINMRRERERVGDAIEQAADRHARGQRQARRLSGGNQQKLTIARWLAAGFQVMLCFDPTRGIDVGTKRQIYVLLRELADGGRRDPALHLRAAGDPARLRPRDRALPGAVSDRLPRHGGRRGPRCCARRTGWSEEAA